MIFVLNVPDVDTDAYIHHSIARQIIMHPKDLSLHWVWLPLFHYLSSTAILLGANMETIRFVNIFIWALIPLILYFFLYKKQIEHNIFLASVSSILCALFPIGILMGTTAQPEPLFALLMLLYIISLSNNKIIISSILLSLACILRYEAWAVLIINLLFYFNDIFKNKKRILNKNLLNILIPGIVVLIWAVLREPFDGKLFGFLFQTQKFANDALRESNSFQGGFLKIIIDLIHYPIIVPAIFTGISLIFIPFGISNFYRQHKYFFYFGVGILIFITASWMMKSNLGLNRHFMVLIPFYTTLTAYGVLAVSNYLKGFSDKFIFLRRINIKISLLIIILISCLIYLIMWLYIWSNNYKEGFPERKVASEYLKNIPENKTIFCNDAIVEIFSDIDFKRFNHIWMENNPGAYDMILQTAKNEGYVYVITTPEKWKDINDIGEKILQSPTNTKTNTTILILKVTGK
jgi:hypothetical protein